jgi:hypothetical protein
MFKGCTSARYKTVDILIVVFMGWHLCPGRVWSRAHGDAKHGSLVGAHQNHCRSIGKLAAYSGLLPPHSFSDWVRQDRTSTKVYRVMIRHESMILVCIFGHRKHKKMI